MAEADFYVTSPIWGCFCPFAGVILGSVFVPMGLPIWISGIPEDFTWGIRAPNTPPLPSILGLP